MYGESNCHGRVFFDNHIFREVLEAAVESRWFAKEPKMLPIDTLWL